MSRNFINVFAFISVFSTQVLYSQHPDLLSENGWELKKEKFDIHVFSKSIDGYKIKAFKAVGKIEATPQVVFNALMDIEKYPDWYPDCKAATLIEKIDSRSQYRSIEYKLPWPFDPRDVVNKIESSMNQGSILMKVISASEYIEPNDKVVRIPRSEGYWLLEPTDNGTLLTYSAIAEAPGVPAWVVNLFVFDGPIGAINNLREVVKSSEYQTSTDWNK